MPSGDRTGPIGQGAMTGRALGLCTGNDSPGFATRFGMGAGRGAGLGRGLGRGIGIGRARGFSRFLWGAPWGQSESKEDEVRMLKSQAEALGRTQKEIEKRLSELDN